MKFIADLHIHSHFSRATSRSLTPEHIEHWAQLKGIDVVGTGDCSHPGWLAELEEKLESAGNGLYRLKKKFKLAGNGALLPERSRRQVYFVLSGEISSIYKKADRVRKIHNICFFEDFEAVRKLQSRLSRRGNIKSDGRPILGLSARDVLETVLETSSNSFLVPAHIWTPWFSVLGEKSGFDSIEECFDDLAGNVFAIETGLSSDPPMNRACSFLDRFRVISNSDAHSPEKLGREANIFETEISYRNILSALKTGKGFSGTIEFFPHEGKYHHDGHRQCGVCWSPEETKKHKGICPKCKKPVTKGVLNRVFALADRKIGPSPGAPFHSITSLPSILSEILEVGPASKKVRAEYFRVLEKMGSDFETLLFADIDEISENCGPRLAEGIKRMRASQVRVEAGYDGEFGKISVF
jgi:DNA helicase II / ATP-dependent DNA helicase PcrA